MQVHRHTANILILIGFLVFAVSLCAEEPVAASAPASSASSPEELAKAVRDREDLDMLKAESLMANAGRIPSGPATKAWRSCVLTAKNEQAVKKCFDTEDKTTK